MLIANTDVGLGFTLYLIVLSFSMEAVHIRTHEEVIVSHMVEQLRVTEKEASGHSASASGHICTHIGPREVSALTPCLFPPTKHSYQNRGIWSFTRVEPGGM